MTLAFVYKWIHIPTGKWYIGSRTKNGCHPEDGYICSSKQVKPLILECRDNWERTILASGNAKEMIKFETDLLVKLDAKNDPMSYNQHNGDGEFSTTGIDPWNKGKKIPTNKPAWNRGLTKDTDSRMAKVSASRQGQPAHNKGRPSLSKGIPNPGVSYARKNILKDVCRLMDRREMSMIYFKQWCDKIDNPEKWAEINAKKSLKQRGIKQTPEHIAKRAAAKKAYHNTKIKGA